MVQATIGVLILCKEFVMVDVCNGCLGRGDLRVEETGLPGGGINSGGGLGGGSSWCGRTSTRRVRIRESEVDSIGEKPVYRFLSVSCITIVLVGTRKIGVASGTLPAHNFGKLPQSWNQLWNVKKKLERSAKRQKIVYCHKESAGELSVGLLTGKPQRRSL